MKAFASPPVSRCCQIHCTFSFLFSCIDSNLFLFGSNRFAGGRFFTVNNLPQVKCNLYHPYSRWCRKACRCLRKILTYRDQRSRCVTFGERLTNFMISISLSEKFCCQPFQAIEVLMALSVS